MSADAAIQGSMALAQSATPKAPVSAPNMAAAKKAAKEYEGVFISEFMGSMFSGISTDGPFGGGQGEALLLRVIGALGRHLGRIEHRAQLLDERALLGVELLRHRHRQPRNVTRLPGPGRQELEQPGFDGARAIDLDLRRRDDGRRQHDGQ